MSDRRKSHRQKSLLRAFVYFGNSASPVECIVRDLSEAGARLKFQYLPTTTHDVDIHIPVKGQKLRADVRWQEGDEIGIAFASATVSATSQPSASATTNALDDELVKRVHRLETEIAALQKLVRRLQQSISSNIDAA
jgi:PilZ domain